MRALRIAVVVAVAVVAGAAVTACGRDRRAPSAAARAPDPRLTAVFAAIFEAGTDAAQKAGQRHRDAVASLSAHRIDD